MKQAIAQIATAIPGEHREGCGYWHAHLPVAAAFIDAKGTPQSIRRLCVELLMDAANKLRSALQERTNDCRVVVAINLPRLFDSQVIVFFGNDYFSRFFARDKPDQEWIALPADRSLARDWSLKLPPAFYEQGFRETTRDGGFESSAAIWFYGDLLNGAAPRT